jgi:hypothetical protein
MFMISRIIVGGVLLTLGRKIFWFLVAGIGFFIAYDLALRFLRGQPEWVTILLAIGVGLLGALLAIFLKNAAIWLVGFLGGGYFALSALGLLGLNQGIFGWIGFIVGGIIGCILIGLFFDWALIIISSFGGAAMIAQALRHLGPPLTYVLFIGLFILGLVIQGIIRTSEVRTGHA